MVVQVDAALRSVVKGFKEELVTSTNLRSLLLRCRQIKDEDTSPSVRGH